MSEQRLVSMVPFGSLAERAMQEAIASGPEEWLMSAVNDPESFDLSEGGEVVDRPAIVEGKPC